ncbi:MAG: hypothetical protein H6662_10125 [Ardenticatenaceae bacterium]|nr:hypothetical protein [Anaerolineales bacterium]MCB8921931.1 hypothetical protein [Ardenticatenaceae bacterium]MCB8989506.1 hypothetical protein [Ardenticatenaceae bacterium]MCB9003050.1 hypothetical protein [Ardenticatenaceae bacterium]
MMMKKQKRIWMILAVLLLLSLFLSVSNIAFAHHMGQNPGVGNLNEEMVHNGKMERAADMGYWNEPWDFDDVPAP